jgi:hypothetical protein
MNERIKELWEESTGATIPAEGFYSSASTYNIEKFAELIVQECASLCEIESRSYTYSFKPAKARLAESTAKHCGTIIKRHFGVEE